MSLLGKVLAVLNILGALALVYTGTVAYAKRQSGAYAVFLADRVLEGLPLDENDRTPRGQPTHELVDDKMQRELFEQAGGKGVSTQMAEVDQVIAYFQEEASKRTDPQERMAYQARVLTPFLDDGIERDWARATRLHLSGPRSLALLRALYDESLRQAILSQDRNEDFLKKAPDYLRAADELKNTWKRALFETAFHRSLQGAPLDDLHEFRELRHYPELVAKKEFSEFKPLRNRRGPRDPMLHDRAITRALTSLEATDPAVKQDATRKQVAEAFKFQASQPSNPITVRFLRGLPKEKMEELVKGQTAIREAEDEPAKAKAARESFEKSYKTAFDTAFNGAVEGHKAWLEDRFTHVFGSDFAKQNRGPTGQRRAIARLLVRSAILRAEDEVTGSAGSEADKKEIQKTLPARPAGVEPGMAPGSAKYHANLASTSAYNKFLRRAQVVVGIKAALGAVSDRAVALRQMPPSVLRQANRERETFVSDNQALLEEARHASRQLDTDAALLIREQRLTMQQDAVLKRRRDDIKLYQGDLLEEQKQTAALFELLDARARKVYDLRLRLRDANGNNQRTLRDIEKREAQIRELDRDTSPGER